MKSVTLAIKEFNKNLVKSNKNLYYILEPKMYFVSNENFKTELCRNKNLIRIINYLIEPKMQKLSMNENFMNKKFIN